MLRPALEIVFLVIVTGMLLARATAAVPEGELPFGLERRIPWTNSTVVGSPDPPLPYTVEKTFTNLQLRSPLFAIAEPGAESLLIIRQGGEKDRPSRIVRVRDDPTTAAAEAFLEISNRLIYSVAFHPGYRTNGHLYVFSNGPTPQSERTNRISRYSVGRDAPYACDPESEHTIIEWRSAGHDGGGLVFGLDGMLYISTGDGTSDSDGWNSGQTVDDLLGGVLRIDINRTQGSQAYSVPKDNPFVGWTNARPELWAYGLRNPWRITADQKTGHIWVGNNGQDLWETAHFIRRGENYGWSVYEGKHPFYLNRKLGPTPVVPPTIEHHHAEARSLTGGLVYYGARLSELHGAYVYGDYSSGTIWGARHDGQKLTWHQELARTELQIAAFAVNHRGELLIVDHGGGIYRLVQAPRQDSAPKFPTRLSETGLFTSTKDHRVAPALIPYSVVAAGWTDGADIERFLALPGESRIEPTNGWTFPNGAVLMQSLSLRLGQEQSPRRVETRLLTRQSGQWVGYSYRWNEAQSDAVLVGAKGEDADLPASDGKQQTWRYPARTECMACHSRAANFVLGFTPLQLNKTYDYGGVTDNQLRTLHHIGVFNGEKPSGGKGKLVNPYDSNEELDARARSYLHVNCSVCHVDAGGGNARMELSITTKPEKMNLVNAWPQHDSFGIENAMLVAPKEPGRSIVYHRMSRRGRGQMPPLVSKIVDETGVALMGEWIASIKPTQTFIRDWKLDELLPALGRVEQNRSIDSGRSAFRETGCNQCHRFAGDGGTIGPDLTGVGQRLTRRELLESIILPSQSICEGYATCEIETKDGNVLTGHIEREDARVFILRQPGDSNPPLEIQKARVKRRVVFPTSNMPTGLLNSLDEGQILDLLAYIISDGDSKHAAFRTLTETAD